jgi:hypothetical protein
VYYFFWNKIRFLLESQNETNYLFTDLLIKAQVNFLPRPFEVRVKMLINGSKTWNSFCFNIFQEVFSMFKFEKSEQNFKIFK